MKGLVLNCGSSSLKYNLIDLNTEQSLFSGQVSRIGLERVESNRRSRVIVVHGGDGRVAGLLVDGVTEVLSVAEDALRPASGEAGSVEALCVRDEEFVSLVDLERVLAVDGE